MARCSYLSHFHPTLSSLTLNNVTGGGKVIMAATCDRGDLTWKLKQVCQHTTSRSKGSRSFVWLSFFGDSGYDKVQSHNVCFPLHVHMGKDNMSFYDNQLSGFFFRLIIWKIDIPTAYISVMELTCPLHRRQQRGEKQ